MSEPDTPPYLREMLTSQTNLYAGLCTVIASAVLSIPYGSAGAMLPLVAFATGEAIASLFVPSWPEFRAKVDRKYRIRRREALKSRLETELRGRSKLKDRNWEVYARLCERARALADASPPRDQNTITANDLERVQDAPGEFLNLWLASINMRERRDALNGAQLQRRIADVEDDIAEGRGDMNSLHRALAELLELQDRHARLESRLAATEAALLALPDVVEEIHLALSHGHGLAAGGTKLGQAVQRLRTQADIDHELAQELGDLPPLPAQPVRHETTPARKAAAASASATAVSHSSTKGRR